MTALSSADPGLPIDWQAPSRAQAARKAPAVYSLPLSVCMITPGTSYGDVISEPIHALVPVPLLAGAALLTFARMIRLGADMDDEIQSTV